MANNIYRNSTIKTKPFALPAPTLQKELEASKPVSELIIGSVKLLGNGPKEAATVISNQLSGQKVSEGAGQTPHSRWLVQGNRFSSGQGVKSCSPSHHSRSKAAGVHRAKQHTNGFFHLLKPNSLKPLGLQANRKLHYLPWKTLRCADSTVLLVLGRTLEVTNEKHQGTFLFSSVRRETAKLIADL